MEILYTTHSEIPSRNAKLSSVQSEKAEFETFVCVD